MIRLEHVQRRYQTSHGPVTVLKDVNFEIHPGEKVGIIGKNGAGKSTMIRLISGAEKPDSGVITRDMSVSWPLAFAGGFQGTLTGLDNLRFICRIYGQNWRDHIDYVQDFTELGRFLREPLNTYSSGMRSRLAFALSMVVDFDCFLIDEIMAVGDHRFHQRCHVELFEKRAHHAMIFVSHDPGFVRTACDRISILHDGVLENFEDLDEGFDFYYRDQAEGFRPVLPREGTLLQRKEELARLLFGSAHSGALNNAIESDAEEIIQDIFSHPLTNDSEVSRYRLDHLLSADDIKLLAMIFDNAIIQRQVGRSLHGVLAKCAEARATCEISKAFLQKFETALPLEGADGLWARMAYEAGSIYRITTFHHARSGRELPLRVDFSRVAVDEHVQNELAEFSISENGLTCRLQIGLPVIYASRLFCTYPIIKPYLEDCELSGSFDFSLGDEGLMGRALSFCSVVSDYLVPDPYFIQTGGYGQERETYSSNRNWDDLIDTAYWRGTDTGAFRYRNYADAPRIAVALLSPPHPELLNARITRVEQRPGYIEKEAFYNESGIFGPEEDQANILKYRYQIDIDGNTNTWSSLFLKLLTGTPVLKLDSEFGFRQWYYGQLSPWENYVPVKADGSDLLEKIDWLRRNQTEARRIGAAGRKLADSINFEVSVHQATNTLAKLVSLNRRTVPTS